MRHFRAIPFLIAAAAITAVVAGTALGAAQTKVAFKGTYIGKVAEKVDGTNVTASGERRRQGHRNRRREAGRRRQGDDGEPAVLADPRSRDDLGPEGQAEDQRHDRLSRLRRGRGRPGQHHGLRHGEGHRRDAQVPEGQGLAALQRPLRPEGRHLQRNPHGQPDLLGDSYERHSKRGAEQHEKNPPAGAGGSRRLRARSRRRRRTRLRSRRRARATRSSSPRP